MEDGDRLMTLDEILKEGATDAPVTPPPESTVVPQPDNHVISAESRPESNAASAHIPPEVRTCDCKTKGFISNKEHFLPYNVAVS